MSERTFSIVQSCIGCFGLLVICGAIAERLLRQAGLL
jgi:hypothetical protein